MSDGTCPWAVLKAIWRQEETTGPRCDLCGGPLVVTMFFGLLSIGKIYRVCLTCKVEYEEPRDGALIRSWIFADRKYAPRAWIYGISFGGSYGHKISEKLRAWIRFARGRWVLRPPKSCGTFYVTSLDGRKPSTKEVDLDPETGVGIPEAHDGWWWSEPIPESRG